MKRPPHVPKDANVFPLLCVLAHCGFFIRCSPIDPSPEKQEQKTVRNVDLRTKNTEIRQEFFC